jgi:ADP-ribose pyrophosphatase
VPAGQSYTAPAMSDDHLRETTLDRRVVHEGRYLTFSVDTIRDASGETRTREVAEHPGAVAIVALAGDDVLLVRQYRHPAGRTLLEVPAGTRDRMPDGSIETPDRTAHRELAEETGYRAATWRKLGSFWSAPGFASELMHLYLAQDLKPVDGYAGPEPDEHLDLVRIPWREAVELCEGGEIVDAKSIVGLFWLARLAARGEI